MSTLRSVDVSDDATFRLLPPCADPRFDHRTCDYWEDADRGSRNARPSMLAPVQQVTRPPRPGLEDNPFAPHRLDDEDTQPFLSAALGATLDPLGGDDLFATPAWNPFAPTTQRERPRTVGVPRKQGLLDRGRGVFGSYARVLLDDERPVAYAQFGPLSAYPRAGRLRELYPQLPDSPAACRHHLRRDHPGGAPARPRAAAHRGGLCGPRVARLRGRGGVSGPDAAR